MGSPRGVGNSRIPENQPTNHHLYLRVEFEIPLESNNYPKNMNINPPILILNSFNWTLKKFSMLDSTATLWNDCPAIYSIGDPDADHL